MREDSAKPPVNKFNKSLFLPKSLDQLLAGFFSIFLYPLPGSNRHAFQQKFLRFPWLPITPRGQIENSGIEPDYFDEVIKSRLARLPANLIDSPI